MNTPRTNPSDVVTSLWLSILYLLGVTLVAGGMIVVICLFSVVILTASDDPTLITDIIPYTIGDIFNESINIFIVFAFLMLFIMMPLQLPGWWVIWKNIGKLRSLPGDTPSLIVSRGMARAAAVAYLWAVIGVGVSIFGFDIYLAILNPDFTWINPDKAGISDILLIIGQALWLMAGVICIQSPVLWGLWSLKRPLSPLPDDPRWRRWRKGAVIYLKWSAAITIMIMAVYWGVNRYKVFMTSKGEFEISDLFIGPLGLVVGFFYIIFFTLHAQLPGWLVMAWLEWKKRQLARIINPPMEPLRLLQGAAIGYLAMITAATPTWWLRLEYINNYDRDMLTPYLTPVLDGLLWAQIPGWAAFSLWLALRLNQKQRAL